MQLTQRLDAIRNFLFYEESQERRRPEVDWVSVRRAQLALLLQKFSLKASIASALVAIATWGLMYWLTRSPWCLAWAVLVHGAQVWRVVQTAKVVRGGPPPDRFTAILREQTMCLWLLGGAWGLAPWMMGLNDTVAFLTVMVFVLGMNASATVVLSSHVQTVVAFVLPSMTGLIAQSVYFGGLLGWLLALYLLQTLLTALRWSFMQVSRLEKSLRTSAENEALAAQLHEQVERVRASEREKTRFIASASHDLRQPLNAATLFAAALSRAHGIGGQDAVLVQRIDDSLAALSASLNGMLDVSRLDAGVVVTHVEPVSLQQVFVALQRTFEQAAEEKGLELRIRSPGALWVLSDALLLERLLGNLIDNAIKHTAQGGVLVLARRRSLEAVSVEVIDTGPGIDPALHERVFDEYFQVHNPERDRGQGLGLGLAIVKRLAGLLGHRLRLHSRPGRGCRLSLELAQASEPAAAMLEHEGDDAAPVDAAVLPRRVLVLDDDRAGVEALRGLLGSYGVQVSAAHDAEQARTLLAQGGAEAVISDFRLPGARSGLDFLLALRQSHPGLPALMMTGETAPERVAVIEQSGVTCLFKPVRPVELLEHLSRMTRSRGREQEAPAAKS